MHLLYNYSKYIVRNQCDFIAFKAADMASLFIGNMSIIIYLVRRFVNVLVFGHSYPAYTLYLHFYHSTPGFSPYGQLSTKSVSKNVVQHRQRAVTQLSFCNSPFTLFLTELTVGLVTEVHKI